MPQYHIDHYGILRVPFGAPKKDINKRFRKELVLKFHPDKIRAKGRVVTKVDENRWNDLNNSFSVLTDDVLRGRYDGNHATMPFACIGSTCISVTTPRGKDATQRRGYKSEISKRYFCSRACANDWERANGYTAEVHGYSEGGAGPGWTPPTPPSTPPPGVDLRKCLGCKQDKKFSSFWVRYSSKDINYGDKWCCTEYCLFEYLISIGQRPKQCNECYVCRKKEDGGDWCRGKKDKNKNYCSEEHQRKKEDGTGFGLGDPDPDNPTSPPGPNPTSPGPGPSPTESDETPIEIEKSRAINIIKSRLVDEPKIENSELINPNWENEINQASEIEKIKQIRDKVLADITAKRNSKLIGSELDSLISQAQSAVKVNNLVLLGELLIKIKSYQNTAIYQSREADIIKLEKHLTDNDPKKAQEILISSLNNALEEDPPVDISELEEKNRNFAVAIKNATPKQQKEIENAVLNDINYKRTVKVVGNLLIRARKVNINDSEELDSIRQEIFRLMESKNEFEKNVWEQNKSKFEQLLSEWSGKGTKNNSNQNPNKLRPVLIGLIVTSLAGATIAGLLIIRQRRRQFNHYKK